MIRRLMLLPLLGILAACHTGSGFHVRSTPGPSGTMLIEVEPRSVATRAQAVEAWEAAAAAAMEDAGCKVWSASAPRVQLRAEEWGHSGLGPDPYRAGAVGWIGCVLPYRPELPQLAKGGE